MFKSLEVFHLTDGTVITCSKDDVERGSADGFVSLHIEEKVIKIPLSSILYIEIYDISEEQLQLEHFGIYRNPKG